MDTNDRMRSRLQRISAPAASSQEAGAANATPASAADDRQAKRKSTIIRGYIICGSTGQETECTVLDMSATGARVKLNLPPPRPFESPRKTPEAFRLIIPADGKEVDGELAWTSGSQIGIHFTSAFRAAKADALRRM